MKNFASPEVDFKLDPNGQNAFSRILTKDHVFWEN